MKGSNMYEFNSDNAHLQKMYSKRSFYCLILVGVSEHVFILGRDRRQGRSWMAGHDVSIQW